MNLLGQTYERYGSTFIGIGTSGDIRNAKAKSPVNSETKQLNKRMTGQIQLKSEFEEELIGVFAHRCQVKIYNIWFGN